MAESNEYFGGQRSVSRWLVNLPNRRTRTQYVGALARYAGYTGRSPDEIVSTGTPSTYLQLLRKFTVLTDKEIQKELSDRQQVLKDLVKQNVRRLDDVCKTTQNYLLKKKAG